MRLVRWNPLRDVTAWNPATENYVNVQQEIDRMFDRVFKGGVTDDGTASTWMPAVDIVEHENDYTVNIEIPGVDKKDVKISIANSVLTVKGEKVIEKEINDKNLHRSERIYGSFQRSFTLPNSVKADKIEASYNNGVLSISLPKAEEAKPKEIEVKLK